MPRTCGENIPSVVGIALPRGMVAAPAPGKPSRRAFQAAVPQARMDAAPMLEHIIRAQGRSKYGAILRVAYGSRSQPRVKKVNRPG